MKGDLLCKSLKFKIKTSQSLVMTPQLQQAIKLLQLNNLELTELVNKELEENPFLENESNEEQVEKFDDETNDLVSHLNLENQLKMNKMKIMTTDGILT